MSLPFDLAAELAATAAGAAAAPPVAQEEGLTTQASFTYQVCI